MSFPGDPTVEVFLDKFVRGDFDINHEDPNTKRLMDALTWYQVGKSGLFMGPLELSKSAARIAISNAMLSRAIKPKEGKRRESPEKNQDKPKVDTLEELKQEFIKYAQEHPPQPNGKQTAADNNSKGTANENVTTTVSKSMTAVYDIAAKEVENAKNAPPEKKKLVHQFLGSLKDNRVVLVQVSWEFIRSFLKSVGYL
jgi:hypothetical protein